MASLSLKHIYKVYDGTTRAVSDFNMEIRDREFIVFVGPSGCGKSTTLRMIAGLEEISAGELSIDGVVVNDMEPRDRNIAMVFQNYALYPHMTVYENMAFSLKTAHVPRDEIHAKVTEAARILGITEYLSRKPRALSGGQRQRVALGRAIVRNPKVFLFDEPLSNLDAKLRADMRAEIIRLYERLGTTFIYVTHDQIEAMTMGSRIVVMKGGVVCQIDTPKNLYNHPASIFVAGFIGTPRMNFWNVTLLRKGERVHIRLEGGGEVTAAYADLYRVQTRYMDGKYPVVLGIRPDDIRPWSEDLGEGYAPLDMTVTVVEALGGETLIYGRLDSGATLSPAGDLSPEGDLSPAGDPSLSGEHAREIILKASAENDIRRGDRLRVGIRLSRLHLFDRATEETLMPRIPQENLCPCEISDGVLTFAGERFPLPPALMSDMLSDASPSEKTKKKLLHGELILPTDAILLGTGCGRARVEAVETVEDTDKGMLMRLYRLAVGAVYEQSVRLFVKESVAEPTEQQPPRYQAGDSVPFDIDFSRITAPNIKPLPRENRLDGMFLKEKQSDRRGYRFLLDVAGRTVEAEADLRERLFSCKGSAIFRTPLTFAFPPEGAQLSPMSPQGLTGRVTAIPDYGRTVYARVSIGGREIVVPAGDPPPAVGSTVSVLIDQRRLTVLDRESGIVIA